MNCLFNALSELDRKRIKNYIFKEAGYWEGSDTSINAPLKNILASWETQKKDLYKLFSEKLILSQEVTIDMGIECLKREIENDPRYYRFRCYLHNQGLKQDLPHDDILKISSLVQPIDIYDNKVLSPTFTIKNCESTKKAEIPQGIKISKALKRLVPVLELDEDKVNEFILNISRWRNNLKLTGELCLSIHPLDYMTMSDNASNWHSCMSWQEKGCYRGGTIECMNSPYVIVGYLKTNTKPFEFGEKCFNESGEEWEWNNKKWRCLFVMDKDLITSIKPYPYDQEELVTKCIDWLADLALQNWGRDFRTDGRSGNFLKGSLFIGNKTEINFQTHYRMYNDFGTCQKGHYYKIHNDLTNDNSTRTITYKYTEPATCVACGVELDDTVGETSVLCGDCCPVAYCDCCEEVHPLSELTSLEYETVCNNCLENYYFLDELTDTYQDLDYREQLIILDDDEKVLYEINSTSEEITDDSYYLSFGSPVYHSDGPYSYQYTINKKFVSEKLLQKI